jgi:hypothetical protein
MRIRSARSTFTSRSAGKSQEFMQSWAITETTLLGIPIRKKTSSEWRARCASRAT